MRKIVHIFIETIMVMFALFDKNSHNFFYKMMSVASNLSSITINNKNFQWGSIPVILMIINEKS